MRSMGIGLMNQIGKGGVIERGVLLVQDGKITKVGPSDSVAIPDEAERIEVANRVIIPGIIDTHSHLGDYSRPAVPGNSDGNEMRNPVESGVRAPFVRPPPPGPPPGSVSPPAAARARRPWACACPVPSGAGCGC